MTRGLICGMIFMGVSCADSKTDSATPSEKTLINVAGTVTGILGGEPHVGVEVCNADKSDCNATDDVGLYSVRCPTTATSHLTAEKTDFRGVLVPFAAEAGPITLPPISLSPESVTRALFTTALIEEDDNAGIIAFSISNGIAGDGINIANIQAIVTHSESTVVYSGENGLPDRDLTATSSNGGGVVVNVPEGNTTITFVGLSETCTKVLGHGSPERLDTPVVSGKVSLIRVECSD